MVLVDRYVDISKGCALRGYEFLLEISQYSCLLSLITAMTRKHSSYLE